MLRRKRNGWETFVFASLMLSALAIGGYAEAAKAPVRTYVGATACSYCHLGEHEGWVQTAHQQIVRDGASETSYVNDADDSGRSDFFDPGKVLVTALPGGSAFDQFGADAPILGKNNRLGPFVQIGATKYAIAYTIGGSADTNPEVADGDFDGRILNGEAQWKQLYITKIGASHYILPIQFNAKTAEYVPYNTGDWYDEDNLPIAKADVKNDVTAYERRCAGCHSTGVTAKLNNNGFWTMGFTDMDVACEACHGPGSDHVVAPTVALKKATIVNPATLVSTTDLNDDGVVNGVDNLIAQNNVCYQCHQQGTGHYGTGDSDDGALLYPSMIGSNGKPVLYQPGQDLRDYFTISQNPNDYWGAHDENGNGMIDVGAEEFIASASNMQQGQDHANGPHAADKTYDHPCFVCHDMHDTGNPFDDWLPHLVTAEIDGVSTSAGRNSLCLTCHATHGDFDDITVADVEIYTAAVTQSVKNHVKNRAFMDVGFETRCTSCHMPPTAKSAIEPGITVGRNGPEEVRGGDMHSHTFEPIWPGFVMQPEDFSWTEFLLVDGFQVGPMPDSCTSCHAHDPAGGSDNIVTQWASSGHADGYGEPFNHWNGEGEVQQGCARCHSSGGFQQLAESSAGGGLPDFDAVTAQSASYPKVLNCETCHVPNGGGETRWQAGQLQQIPFPSGAVKDLGDSSNICMQCHQGRESGKSVENASLPRGFINLHYFAEAAMYFGTDVTAGYEQPDMPYGPYAGQNGFIGHEQIERQNCIQCHLNTTNQETGGVKKDHDFFPNIEDCSGCHYDEEGFPLEDFDQLGEPFGWGLNPVYRKYYDYDGDGVIESFRHEVDGMQATLIVEMNRYAKAHGLTAIMYTPGSYPYWAKASCYQSDSTCVAPQPQGTYTFSDRELLGAAFNYHLAQDPGAGIHNHNYVVQVVYDSVLAMGGAPGYMVRP